jgi:hypothetical protein
MKFRLNWIAGGMTGLTLPILFAIIAYVLFLIFGISIQNFPPFSQINYFFFSQCIFFTQCRGQGCLVCILWIPILVLSELFLLGSLVGWIFSKQKK